MKKEPSLNPNRRIQGKKKLSIFKGKIQMAPNLRLLDSGFFGLSMVRKQHAFSRNYNSTFGF